MRPCIVDGRESRRDEPAGRAHPDAPLRQRRFSGRAGVGGLAATALYECRQPEGIGPEQFRCRAQAWRLDTLAVSAGYQSAVCFTRTPERVRADARDNLCLMLAQGGGWKGEFDGLDIEVSRGRIDVIDFARPFASSSPDTDFVMLSIPRPLLAAGGEGEWHGRVLDGIAGRMLAGQVEALVQLLPEACADFGDVSAHAPDGSPA